MARRSIGLAVAVVLASAGWRRVEAEDSLRVVIRIHAARGVQSGVADRSRVRVETILSHAGIRVAWRDCRASAVRGSGCDEAASPDEALVRLLSGPPTLSADGCGVALVPTSGPAHFISLFVDCIHGAADALMLDEDVIFAYTLAHEIGHLLLGSAHEPLGLMRAQPRAIDWERAAHGGLMFTPDEARRLQQALISRARVRTD